MELEQILEALCADVPEAIGAVLCDYEGETVVVALGAAEPPAEALVLARDHIPRNLALQMPLKAFLMRLAGAEPCALMRLFAAQCEGAGAGPLVAFSIRYREVDLLVERLPEDFYLVLAVRRPAVVGLARRAARRAVEVLVPHLS